MEMVTNRRVENSDAQVKGRRQERPTDPIRRWEASKALSELKRLHTRQPDAFARNLNRRALAGVGDVLFSDVAWISHGAEC